MIRASFGFSCFRSIKIGKNRTMIRETSERDTAVADIRLARIEPVGVAVGRAAWGQHRRQNGQDSPKRRPAAHVNLVRSLLPDRDPETCEVDYVVNGTGTVIAVVIRDARSHVELARVPASALSSFAGDRAAAGLLFEMRG